MLRRFQIIISLYAGRKVSFCIVAYRSGSRFAFNGRPFPLFAAGLIRKKVWGELRGNRLSNDDVETVFRFRMAAFALLSD